MRCSTVEDEVSLSAALYAFHLPGFEAADSISCAMEGKPMTEIVFQVEEDLADGGWVASAVGVGITTQAETLDELKTMIRDALKCHYEKPEEIPPMIRLHFVRDEVIAFGG
jgi:predicted RNase H-like HicB family nuclease